MLRTAIFNDGENFRHTICDLFANPRGIKFNSSVHSFNRDDYLPKGADWAGFFQHIVQQSEIEGISSRLARAYWYVVGAVDTHPQLPQKVRKPNLDKRVYNLEKLNEWRERNVSNIQALVESAKPEGHSRKFSAKPEGVEEILDELRRRKHGKEKQFNGQSILQRAIVLKHRSIEFRRSGGIRYDLFAKRYGQEKTTDVNLAVDMVLLKDTYDIAVIVSGDQDFVPAALAAKNLGKTVVNVAFKTRSGKLLPGGAKRLNEAVDWCVKVDYNIFHDYLFPKPCSSTEQGG